MKKLFPLFVLSLVMLGCEGPEGPTGAKGKDGVDGNANVVVTEKQVSTGSWSLSSTGRFYIANVAVSSIDQDIVSYGSVIVYYSTDNVYWGLLPSINASTPSGDVFVIDCFYTVGSVQLQAQLVGANSGTYPSSTLYLKVITIASRYLAKQGANKVNWNDYNEVKRKFNLQD